MGLDAMIIFWMLSFKPAFSSSLKKKMNCGDIYSDNRTGLHSPGPEQDPE